MVTDMNLVLTSVTRREYIPVARRPLPAGDGHYTEHQIHVLKICGTAVVIEYICITRRSVCFSWLGGQSLPTLHWHGGWPGVQ